MTPNRIPVTEVLTWLNNQQPKLHACAVIDRDWVWIVADLRGEQNKPAREAIKKFGFRFAVKGHNLPSGATAFWGHSCLRPTKFFKRKNHNPALARKPEQEDTTLEELAAAFF